MALIPPKNQELQEGASKEKDEQGRKEQPLLVRGSRNVQRATLTRPSNFVRHASRHISRQVSEFGQQLQKQETLHCSYQLSLCWMSFGRWQPRYTDDTTMALFYPAGLHY